MSGLSVVIIVGEVVLGILLVTGLLVRYALRQPEAGIVLLWGVLALAMLLSIAVFVALASGDVPEWPHSAAAVALALTATYGRSSIRLLDGRFGYRFTGGPAPENRVRFGATHARQQRRGWVRHLCAWAIGCGLLALGTLLVGETDKAKALVFTIQLWSVILAADFGISFSYALFPKKTDRSELQLPPSGV